MKNYSLDSEDEKIFILNYRIKRNKIIIYFANGKKRTVEYSIEEEKEILEKMKQQVLESNDFKYKQLNDKYNSSLYSLSCEILYVLNILKFSSLSPKTLNIYTCWFIISMIILLSSIFNNDAKIKDIVKNMNILINQDELNKKIRTNKNLLANVSKKTKKFINSIPEESEIFNLHSADKFSYDDIRTIINNILQQELDDNVKSNILSNNNTTL